MASSESRKRKRACDTGTVTISTDYSERKVQNAQNFCFYAWRLFMETRFHNPGLKFFIRPCLSARNRGCVIWMFCRSGSNLILCNRTFMYPEQASQLVKAFCTVLAQTDFSRVGVEYDRW